MQWKSAILREWSRDKIKPVHLTGMWFGTFCCFSKAEMKILKKEGGKNY